MGPILFLVDVGLAIWVLVDAQNIGVEKGQLQGLADMGPLGWFFLCLLLPPVGLPFYVATREKYKRISTRSSVSDAVGVVSPSIPAAEEPSKSFLSRLVGVFLSPGETFADIARRPDVLAPLVVNMLATVAFFEVMLSKIGMERIIRIQLTNSSRGASMTPDQIDQAVSQGAKIGAIFTHITGFAVTPIVLLIIAAVGLGIVKLIFGAQTNFRTAFSITCYASLVNVLGVIIGIVLIFLGDPDHFNPNAPLPTAPAFFMDQAHTSRALFSIATSLDIFTFWVMALLGIGFAATTGGRSKPLTAFFAFVAVWAVYVLAKVGIAAM